MPDNIPQTPQSTDKDALGFTRRPMVRWFQPTQLIRTGLGAVVSGIFGSFADRREMQAALHAAGPGATIGGRLMTTPYYLFPPGRERWIDFVADIGDGWRSTYSVASLLAKATLTLRHRSQEYVTRRGAALIMGGDEVYPAARREEYNDRLVGPYRSALCWLPPNERPDLYAIPGNHDWYDGLTSFIRMFCQERSIGAWLTRQTRSYFALSLGSGWWLWGLDLQLDSDIDKPQLDYFAALARDHVTKGDRIILCVPEPSWVYTGTKSANAFDNLDFFERTIITRRGASVALTLSGDLHHYSRYKHNPEKQKITAGGGGAFLHGTNHLPEMLELKEGTSTTSYQLQAAFPTTATSRWLVFTRFLLFPFKNISFVFFLSGMYLLYAWLLQSASKPGLTLMEKVNQHSPWNLNDISTVFAEYFRVLAHSPSSVVFAFVFVLGLYAFCDASSRLVKLLCGSLHGLAHLCLNLALIWWFSCLNLNPGNTLQMFFCITDVDQPLQVFLFSAEMAFFGGLLGGSLMGFYLMLCDLFFGFHENEMFSSMRIPHYKNFLRMHIGDDGTLTVYPIGIRKVCSGFRLNLQAKDGAPWFIPAKGNVESLVHLIEPPISFPAPTTKGRSKLEETVHQ